MFAREGYVLIGVSIILGLALFWVAGFLSGFVSWVLLALAVLAPLFTLYFFRDPRRVPPAESATGRLLLSPADGKIVLIDAVEEPLYLQGPATQISIFLSPLNVHVNRIPADGVIEYVDYVPGDYLVAWHEKASELNERSILGLLHPSGIKVLFKQIAGAVARRIVFHIEEGDVVKAGDRFGIVKFGSRMDILVPPEVEVTAGVGDRVRGGLTILGRLPEFDADASGSAGSADSVHPPEPA